jgi:hypothetical protein
MFSLLGKEMDVKGYVFKPFLLLLGVLYFILLLLLLGALYIVLFLRNTLENILNNIEKSIIKYSRLK